MERSTNPSFRITSEPFAEVVDLSEMKAHLRVDGELQDGEISAWTTAARRLVEDWSGRQLVTATLRMRLDRFPTFCQNGRRVEDYPVDRYAIVVPRSPLQSVVSIAYVDESGATRTIDADDYHVDADGEPGRITPAYGTSWPVARLQPAAVTLTVRCGHATPFTANATTNVLTAKGRTFANGDLLRVANSGGALPTGLARDTEYYVVEAAGGAGATFKLSLTEGGSAVDVADAGQGTHFLSNPSAGLADIEGPRAAVKLIVGHWNENREAVLTGTISKEIEFAVESLVTQAKVY